jgi:phosphate starvation-inducible protein PhoH
MFFFGIVPFTLIIMLNGYNFFKIFSKTYTNGDIQLYMKRDKISNLNTFEVPIGLNQKKYCKVLDNNDNSIIVAYGPAGTGKTMFACLKAITSLKRGEFNKIILTRPVVAVEEELGFLPGNIVKKMDPWTRPIFDIFMEHYSKTEIDNMLYNNIIEISPLAFMRGRTFKNAFIIADEMQNSSPNQMMMLTTRIGTNSRMVITGDLNQSDKSKNNGLTDLISKLQIYYNFNNSTDDKSNIKLVELEVSDIERSEVVKKMIDIYNYKVPETKPLIQTQNQTHNQTQNQTQKQSTSQITINYNYKRINYTSSNNDSALIPKSHSFRKIWEQ